MEFAQIVVLAVLVEAVWEAAKMVWQDGKFSVSMIATLVIGIALAILSGADLCAAVGIGLPPIVGQIVTGILISRGSNYLHDLISKIGSNKNEVQA